MQIGFIGLGHMGNPMVRNLVKAGHALWVYDIDEHAVAAAEALGAQAASIAEMAKATDCVFTMLQSGEQVRTVCVAEDGLFSQAHADLLYIDCSTIDVTTSRELHAAAQVHGLAMLDAPVSGGVAGAEAASLTIMVGGRASHYSRAEPILSALGKRLVHTGGAGNGQVAKLCNNMILGISMLGISEAFVLAEKLGLPAETLFAVANHASGQCWALSHYCPVPGILPQAPASHDYTPGFTSQMMLKDLLLSQQAAANAHASTPMGAAATSLYSVFVNQGGGDSDFSAIIQLIKGTG